MPLLDTNSAVPLFEQLKLALRERLDNGVLPPGARLPSEAELCEKYNVSRITVRRAVDDLVEDGYLERHQGKGTFVAAKRTPISVMSLSRRTSEGFQLRYQERKRSIIISKKEYPANRFEQEWLHLTPQDNVLVLTRQMQLDGEPWMIDRATYSAKRFPGFFERIEDNTSTYALIEKDYGVIMNRAHREISLTYATNEQAKLLACSAGTPLFKTFKAVYDVQGEPVHLSSTFTQAENVVLTVENDSYLDQRMLSPKEN